MRDPGLPAQSNDPWGPWGPALRLVLVAPATILGLWVLLTLGALVVQLLLATILATGLTPLAYRLEHRGLPRALSVLLTYALVIVALLIVGVIVIPPLVQQIEAVVANAPQYADRVMGGLRDLQRQVPILPPLDEQMSERLRGLSGQVGEVAGRALAAGGVVLGALSGLMGVGLVLLLALYLTVDGARIREYVLSFLDPARRPPVRSLLDRMGERMGQWVRGQATLSALIGLITFVGLTLIGVPGALLLAVLAALGEVIPLVGPILAAIPAILVAALQSPVQGLLALVFFVVLQQVDGYVLIPTIIGRAVKLSPLAVLLAVVIGSTLLGLVGALLAVPVAAALAVVLDEARQQRARAALEAPVADKQRTEP